MNFLIDTHALLWALDAPGKLSPRVVQILRDSDANVCISLATPWELAIKSNLGKLDVSALLPTFERTVATAHYRVLETSITHAIQAGLLPLHHRDPFDRLMIAQALDLRMPILSCDTVFDQYGVQRIWR